MNADQPTPAEPDGLDLADFAFPEHLGDVRRAVRRGVLRTGFAAACWLLLAAVLVTMAWVGAGAARSGSFHDLVYNGVRVAHPEYEISQGLYSNFGTTTMELEFQPRGAIGGHETGLGSAVQPVIGDFTVQLGQPDETPIRRALRHSPPAKSTTAKYLDSLPASVSASAVVAFARPLDAAAYAEVASRAGGAMGLDTAIFLTDPYADQPVISWPTPDVTEYVHWAKGLHSGDDDALGRLDLPPAARLRAVADDPLIRAFVVDRASVPELRKLLAEPLIASVTIADVGFDVASQFPQN